MRMTREVSLYNASYEKMFELEWKRAVILYITGKVCPHIESDFLDIQTSSGIFKLPRKIVLKKYVHIPYRDPAPTRKNIMKRDNYTCQYCYVELDKCTPTIDHILPRARGGKHEWTNVVACCIKCNRKKGNRTPEEANMPLIRKPKPLRFRFD